MKKQTLHYAGYTIEISYDKTTEEYEYVISDKDKNELFKEGRFEDNNDAFASACMKINNET